MSKLQILAIGSPFGLDRVAWIVAKRLKENLIFPGLTIHILDRPGVQLINYLKDEPVLILDAVMMNAAFGKLIEFDVTAEKIQQLKSLQSQHYSTHSMGLAYSLELAVSLEQLPQHCHFIGFNINHPEQLATLSSIRYYHKFVTEYVTVFF